MLDRKIILATVITMMLATAAVFSYIHGVVTMAKEPTIANCTFATGTIIAKRQYCVHDCRYTLIVGFNNKSTEVDVPKERYEFGIVGGQIDVLINCK